MEYIKKLFKRFLLKSEKCICPHYDIRYVIIRDYLYDEMTDNDEEIEQYNGYSENWAYWTTITLSNGECYDIEVYAPYINNKIVIEGEVNVSIFEMDEDEHIDTITTNICKL